MEKLMEKQSLWERPATDSKLNAHLSLCVWVLIKMQMLFCRQELLNIQIAHPPISFHLNFTLSDEPHSDHNLSFNKLFSSKVNLVYFFEERLTFYPLNILKYGHLFNYCCFYW